MCCRSYLAGLTAVFHPLLTARGSYSLTNGAHLHFSTVISAAYEPYKREILVPVKPCDLFLKRQQDWQRGIKKSPSCFICHFDFPQMLMFLALVVSAGSSLVAKSTQAWAQGSHEAPQCSRAILPTVASLASSIKQRQHKNKSAVWRFPGFTSSSNREKQWWKQTVELGFKKLLPCFTALAPTLRWLCPHVYSDHSTKTVPAIPYSPQAGSRVVYNNWDPGLISKVWPFNSATRKQT